MQIGCCITVPILPHQTKVFFINLVPSSEETSFLTTFYGLYFSHHLHILHITNHDGPSVWAVTHLLLLLPRHVL